MDEKHIVVVTGIVQYKSKILILKRNENEEVHPGKWSFPGGKVIKGENLTTALKREIKEETNLEIKDKKKLISDYQFTRPSGTPAIGFCFLVDVKHNKVKLSKEFITYKWITINNIEDYDIIPYQKEELRKVFNPKHKSF